MASATYERFGNCSYVSRPFLDILMTPEAYPISTQVSLPSSVSFPTSFPPSLSFLSLWHGRELFHAQSSEANPARKLTLASLSSSLLRG